MVISGFDMSWNFTGHLESITRTYLYCSIVWNEIAKNRNSLDLCLGSASMWGIVSSEEYGRRIEHGRSTLNGLRMREIVEENIEYDHHHHRHEMHYFQYPWSSCTFKGRFRDVKKWLLREKTMLLNLYKGMEHWLLCTQKWGRKWDRVRRRFLASKRSAYSHILKT